MDEPLQLMTTYPSSPRFTGGVASISTVLALTGRVSPAGSRFECSSDFLMWVSMRAVSDQPAVGGVDLVALLCGGDAQEQTGDCQSYSSSTAAGRNAWARGDKRGGMLV